MGTDRQYRRDSGVSITAKGKYRRKRERRQRMLETGVAELGLPTQTVHVLERAGIRTAGELFGKTEAELLAIPGIGPKTVEAIREKQK